jgi:hypothetical protein
MSNSQEKSQRISFSGKIWPNPNDLIPKIYAKMASELKSHRISYGQEFEYPELAQALRENHYYLRANRISPDYFLIKKDPHHPGGFVILLYSAKFPSPEKTREIQVQKNDNYPFKKALLLDALNKFLEKRKQKLLQNEKKCEKCGVTKNNRISLDLIIENFDLEDRLEELLPDHPKSQLYGAVKYNYEESDKISLSYGNPIVQTIIHEINQMKTHIFCDKCANLWTKSQLLDELNDPNVNNQRIRQIVRQLTKKNLDSELIQLCERLLHAFDQPLESISPSLQRIWSEFHFIAKDLYEQPKTRPFFGKWVATIKKHNYLNNWIGLGMLRILYRLDESAMNHVFHELLKDSQFNFFQFFRTMGQYTRNSSMIDFFLQFHSQSSEIHDNIHHALQGLLFTLQKPILDDIANRFLEFPPELQRTIIITLYKLGAASSTDILEGIFNDSQKQIGDDLHRFFETVRKDAEMKAALKDEEAVAYEAAISAEKIAVKPEYNEWKLKKGPSPIQMRDIAGKLVLQKYKPLIESHVQTYRAEFENYFQTHAEPIAALDIEEWNFRMFCILAIEIKPDLQVFVKLMVVDDIYPIERYTPKLRGQIRNWLKTLPGSIVISHGSNEEEAGMIHDSGHQQVNTQEYLHKVRFASEKYATQISGEGLKHFEEFIQFKRVGCSFLKHNITAQLFYEQAAISLDHQLMQIPQRTCGICHLEQDVLQYCLEDAFSSMLIYIYFQNHEPEIINSGEFS